MDRPSTPPPQSADHRASFDSPRSVNSNSQEAYTSLSDLMKQKKKPRTSSNPKPQPLRLGQESSASPDRHRGARVAGQRGQNYGAVSDAAAAKKKEKNRHKKLSFKQLVALTISMGGSQIAWVVELGYGTPYLLSLGLSEQLTSLVWLAGPISGLIAQPLIGAISDSSLSKYRRRSWIVGATILLAASALALAFTEPLADILVDLFRGGVADWDPKRQELVQSTAIAIAVIAFYALDFALNGLQGSLRNLALDVVPGEQLATASAWHGRFSHFGNILGYALGSLNLANAPILKYVGGGQFRKICIIAIVALVTTVWATVWFTEEEEREEQFGQKKSKFTDVFSTIYEAVIHLPKPVRRVCYVQICAFMGWFPYLFYSTTWVAEVMATEIGRDPNVDDATRAGSLALLIYSSVAIVAGVLLPYLAARDHRLLRPDNEKHGHDDDESDEEDEDDKELKRIQDMVREWKAEAHREGKPLKLPIMPFLLRNIWTSTLLLFAFLMFTTFFINKVWQATLMIALVGICWAVACWVPFAIIMEYLKEVDDRGKEGGEKPQAGRAERPHTAAGGFAGRPGHARAASTPVVWNPPSAPTERTGLIRSLSMANIDDLNEEVDYAGSKPAGGTIMGIHNLAIVFPQFLIAVIASLIFKWVDGEAPATGGLVKQHHAQTSGVAWTLRFGGLMAVVGALICRKVAPTKTEKAMRRRLAEIKEQTENDEV